MITRKHLFFAISVTCLLTTFLFGIIPIRSQSAGQYDPWLDIDDSGTIGGFDLAWVARAFGTYGTPTNKTALLLELESRLDSLNASFLNLEAYIETSLIEVQYRIESLNATVTQLNNTITEQLLRIDALNTTLSEMKTLSQIVAGDSSVSFTPTTASYRVVIIAKGDVEHTTDNSVCLKNDESIIDSVDTRLMPSSGSGFSSFSLQWIGTLPAGIHIISIAPQTGAVTKVRILVLEFSP